MRVVPIMRGAGQTAALRMLQVRDGSQRAGQPNGSNWLGYSAPYLAGESRFLCAGTMSPAPCALACCPRLNC